jgi:type IV secretory pathway TrbF-like protein
MLAFEEDLEPEERDFIGKILQAAYRARRGSLVPHVVAVYDQGEARAVDNALKKIREGK